MQTPARWRSFVTGGLNHRGRREMDHSSTLTVVSAEAEARTWRACRFQARPSTASVWLPSRSTGPAAFCGHTGQECHAVVVD